MLPVAFPRQRHRVSVARLSGRLLELYEDLIRGKFARVIDVLGIYYFSFTIVPRNNGNACTRTLVRPGNVSDSTISSEQLVSV